MTDTPIPFVPAVVKNYGRYERDLTGNFILPPLETIVNELFAKEGNIAQFLKENAGDEQNDRSKLLFLIMFEMKGKPEEEKWDLLFQLHQKKQQILMESNLIAAMSQPNMAESKPDKVFAILERLDPAKWAKKTSKTKSELKNPYADMMNE